MHLAPLMNRGIRAAKVISCGLALTATPALASCEFPDAVKREGSIPRYFYAHLAEAAGVDTNYMLVAAGEFFIWDVQVGTDGPFACIEASTVATCTQGVALCVHAIAKPDLSDVVLTTWAHSIGYAGSSGGEWPDLRSFSTTYDGIFEQDFVYDMGQYHARERVKIAPWPGMEDNDG